MAHVEEADNAEDDAEYDPGAVALCAVVSCGYVCQFLRLPTQRLLRAAVSAKTLIAVKACRLAIGRMATGPPTAKPQEPRTRSKQRCP
jgi:hypothetical protein